VRCGCVAVAFNFSIYLKPVLCTTVLVLIKLTKCPRPVRLCCGCGKL